MLDDEELEMLVVLRMSRHSIKCMRAHSNHLTAHERPDYRLPIVFALFAHMFVFVFVRSWLFGVRGEPVREQLRFANVRSCSFVMVICTNTDP